MLHPTYRSTPGRMGCRSLEGTPACQVSGGHLRFPAWLGDGNLGEEGPGVCPLCPTKLVWGQS